MGNSNKFSQDYPLNILIAEPEPDSRFSAHDALIQLGYRPEVATSGQEILDLTSIKTYDVILMDIRLPEAEDILASRRGDAGNRRPIFIAMTMDGHADFREMWLESGMDHSISKPVDPAELSLQLIACSLLTGNRHIRPAV